MGVITLKIDDALEKKMRKQVGLLHGARRGAISQTVEEALKAWLSNLSMPVSQDASKLFVAMKDEKKVAEASSLEALGRKLEEAGISPRNVIIESIPEEASVTRMGLRTVRRTKH